MRILAITQARYGSTRLPAKVLKKVNGVTLLETHLRRILQSKLITKLKVATTNEEGAEHITDIAERVGVEWYKGSVNDVLDRFYQTALPEMPDYVVRLTSDCPLIDPAIIDHIIQYCIDNDFDYVSNGMHPTYPDGMDTEVFKFSALETAWKEANLQSEREHVTPYIKKLGTFRGGFVFKSDNVDNFDDWSEYRITVDEPQDFELVKALIENLGVDKSCADYVDYIKNHQEVKELNSYFQRNEGYVKSLQNDKVIK